MILFSFSIFSLVSDAGCPSAFQQVPDAVEIVDMEKTTLTKLKEDGVICSFFLFVVVVTQIVHGYFTAHLLLTAIISTYCNKREKDNTQGSSTRWWDKANLIATFKSQITSKWKNANTHSCCGEQSTIWPDHTQHIHLVLWWCCPQVSCNTVL